MHRPLAATETLCGEVRTPLARMLPTRAVNAVPYRLLEEAPELGHGDRDAGNMLIQGDNLDAL